MVSTGGTVKAMIGAIAKLANTKVNGVYCINNKSNYGSQQEEIFGKEYKYLFDTAIKNNSVEADWSRSLKNIFWQGIDERLFDLTKDCATFSNFSKNGYQVGALIMAADSFEIAAWGFRKANIHAEQDAITMLKNNCPDWENREFSLYTTLEPCVYRNGNYTACSNLICEIPQIRWVIIGDTDTADKKINGAGIAKLREFKHLRLIKTKEIMRSQNLVPHFIK
jgi:pyrimidine deaminase RibD-like protein